LHEELTTLLSQYDINAAAASVKVYAVKPGDSKAKSAAVRRVAHEESAMKSIPTNLWS